MYISKAWDCVKSTIPPASAGRIFLFEWNGHGTFRYFSIIQITEPLYWCSWSGKLYSRVVALMPLVSTTQMGVHIFSLKIIASEGYVSVGWSLLSREEPWESSAAAQPLQTPRRVSVESDLIIFGFRLCQRGTVKSQIYRENELLGYNNDIPAGKWAFRIQHWHTKGCLAGETWSLL